MTSNSDPIVSANDWSKVPLHKKWWFQAVLTFLIIPVGLILIFFVPAYQKKKGQVEKVGKGTKSILAVLAVVVVTFNLVRWAGSGSDELEVSLRGYGLAIRNIGQGPIEIRDAVINDRAECSRPNDPKVIKVGESTPWLTACQSIVRATIKTDRGNFSFTFTR